MNAYLNLADVPKVDAADLGILMRKLIDRGQGLALLKGLDEAGVRSLEDEIWSEFEGTAQSRLAVTLRFRALVQVFSARRLKDLLLTRGFRVIAAAINEAATQPLNTRFGFKAQALVMALDTATERPATKVTIAPEFRIAA
jgi:hypothetical protein